MTAIAYGAVDKVTKAGDTMTGTLVLQGSPPMQIAAGGAAGSVLTSDASGNASWQAPGAVTGVDWLNVKAYGATGNGTTDDTTAIRNALAACPGGGTVYLPVGIYATSGALTIPPGVTLRGSHGAHLDPTDAFNTTSIKPLASFSDTVCVQFLGQAQAGYSDVSCEQKLVDLTLDGSRLSGSTIDGMSATGLVHGVQMDNVCVRSFPNHGLATTVVSNLGPYSWRMTRCIFESCGGIGLSLNNMTDCTFIDVESFNNGGNGWFIGGYSDSIFQNCRAEWNAFDGFNIQCNGLLMIGCTTDSNNQNGVHLQSGGTSGTYLLYDLKLNRDGRNGGSGGGSYAGLNIGSTTIPVIVANVGCNVNVDDNGSGPNRPQYGAAFSGNTYVSVSGGHLWGVSAGWHDGGSNTSLLRGPNVLESTGNVGSRVLAPTAAWYADGSGNITTQGSLDVVGRALGVPQPRDHGLIAWNADPDVVNTGTAVTNGTIYLTAVYVPRSTTCTRVRWGINTAGVTPTSSQNWVGLYNSAGTLMASVNVDANVTSTGPLTATISSQNLTPGLYYVAFVFNAATPPQVYRAVGGLNATLINLGVSGAAARYATNGTGQTSLPGSLTLSSNTVSSTPYWAALQP